MLVKEILLSKIKGLAETRQNSLKLLSIQSHHTIRQVSICQGSVFSNNFKYLVQIRQWRNNYSGNYYKKYMLRIQ